jgi:hypothetical protein
MRNFLIVATMMFFAAASGDTPVLAALPFQQESDVAETKKSEALARVAACGGRIVRISQAGLETEISFYLVGDKVSDAQLEGISAIPDVVWLNLANTKITDQGLTQLKGMKLRKLHLENTAIGDAGLANIKDQVDLEYLNLYGTSVTDKGLQHLQKMTKLKRLYVWQTKVSDAGIKSIREKIPGLKVIGECKLPSVPEKAEEPKKAEPDKAESKKKEAIKVDAAKKKPKKTDGEKLESPAKKE